MTAFLLTGPHQSASFRIQDVEARSRRFLRRGLFVSGAVHVALLFVFLSVWGHGDEILPRVNGGSVDLIPRVNPPVIPNVAPPPAGAATADQAKQGIFHPVINQAIDPDIHGFDLGNLPPDRGNDGGAARSGPSDPSTGPLPDPNHVYTVGDVEAPPIPVFAPIPVYPEIAREAGITGVVSLRVLVNADGTVRQVLVERGVRFLSEAAQEALYRWRFRPAMMNGKPVAVWVEVPVRFVL